MKFRSFSIALLLVPCLWAQDAIQVDPSVPVDSPYKAQQPTIILPQQPQKNPGASYDQKLAQDERDARFLMDLQVANQVRSAQSADQIRSNQEKASAAMMEYYASLIGQQKAAQSASNGSQPGQYSASQASIQAGRSPLGAASTAVAGAAANQISADKASQGSKSGPLDEVAGEDGPAIARSKGLGYIPKGTIIDIRLYTRVNTSIPGPVVGEVVFDVWDCDMKYIVIPRGTKAMGSSSQMGSDTDGGGKVVFDTFISPTGKEIPIAIPVLTASRIGITGVPGHVDYHWGRVFGGSLALALLTGFTSDTSSPAGNNTSMTQGDAVRQNMQTQVNSIGNSYLNRFINIKPDITLEEGTISKVIILQHMMLKPYQKVYR